VGLPVFETPTEPINGTNTIYTTQAPYVAKSTRVWLNGLLQRKDLIDGWVELGGKKVQMQEAPETGDVLQIYYIAQ
jgi:hypothetical protein